MITRARIAPQENSVALRRLAKIDRLHLAGNAAHSMTVSRMNLAELDLQELESALEARGRERFHARQLYRWVYKRGVVDLDVMTDLSKELRGSLAADVDRKSVV